MTQGAGLTITAVTLLGVAALTLSGCGYKTDPVPPATVLPQPVEDLRYSLGQEQVRLSWTFPNENIKGDDLAEVSNFQLFRAEIALEDYCPSCPVPFVEPIEIDGGQTIVDGRRRVATYDYQELREGHKYFFKVRSQSGWWATSGDSNIVTFVWNIPAAAPEGLTASGADSSVKLSWQPVTSRRDGEPVATELVYQLQRRTGQGEFAPVGKLVSSTSGEDRNVNNGTEYSYRVQAVLRFGDDLVYSEPSVPVTVTPVDTTPPVAPTGVLVFGTEQGMRVFWEPSTSADVAGYHIYRRSGGSVKKVGSVESPDTSFVDTSAAEGGSYSYSVSAYDRTKPANESKRSPEASPRY